MSKTRNKRNKDNKWKWKEGIDFNAVEHWS